MSIKTAAIPVGATISPSGGTSTNLAVIGSSLDTVNTYLDSSGVTQLTRKNLTFSVKQPRVNASSPGGYTQGRSAVKLEAPKVLSNNARTKNSLKIELSIDPETTAAEVTDMLTNAALTLIDADFSSFWLNQSTN